METNTLGHEGTGSQPVLTALLTVDELCAVLKIGRTQVYRLVAGGEIRTVRVGERIRFRPEDVDAYLERP